MLPCHYYIILFRNKDLIESDDCARCTWRRRRACFISASLSALVSCLNCTRSMSALKKAHKKHWKGTAEFVFLEQITEENTTDIGKWDETQVITQWELLLLGWVDENWVSFVRGDWVGRRWKSDAKGLLDLINKFPIQEEQQFSPRQSQSLTVTVQKSLWW